MSNIGRTLESLEQQEIVEMKIEVNKQAYKFPAMYWETENPNHHHFIVSPNLVPGFSNIQFDENTGWMLSGDFEIKTEYEYRPQKLIGTKEGIRGQFRFPIKSIKKSIIKLSIKELVKHNEEFLLDILTAKLKDENAKAGKRQRVHLYKKPKR